MSAFYLSEEQNSLVVNNKHPQKEWFTVCKLADGMLEIDSYVDYYVSMFTTVCEFAVLRDLGVFQFNKK